jgi:cation/acetate symporter
MSVLWRGTTTTGAVVGGLLGLTSATAMVVLGPSVWEKTLGHPAGSALFPYDSPALFSMPLAFVGIFLFSTFDRSVRGNRERAAFAAQRVRSETGLGALGAVAH